MTNLSNCDYITFLACLTKKKQDTVRVVLDKYGLGRGVIQFSRSIVYLKMYTPKA